MWETILEAVVFALALCADSFAVSTCSSVTIKRLNAWHIAKVSLIFGIIQAGLLLVGYLFGDLFVGHILRFSGWLAFGILLYVGGSMIRSSLSQECEVRRLDSTANILLGGVATSIDALAVGVSLSLGQVKTTEIAADTVAVLVFTILTVVAGMLFGHRIGHRFAKKAEMVGGIVLITLGIKLLVGSF